MDEFSYKSKYNKYKGLFEIIDVIFKKKELVLEIITDKLEYHISKSVLQDFEN